jgi:hypothetical protein
MVRSLAAALLTAALAVLSVASISAQTLTLPPAADTAPAQSPQPVVRENPHKKAAIGLMLGGLGLFALGFVGGCDENDPDFDKAYQCIVGNMDHHRGKLKLLGVLGMGGGSYLYWRGEQERRRPSLRPVVRVAPHRLSVSSAIGF